MPERVRADPVCVQAAGISFGEDYAIGRMFEELIERTIEAMKTFKP